MKNPRAILFDLDGVLVESYAVWYHLLNQTARELGYPEISRELYRARAGARARSPTAIGSFPRHSVQMSSASTRSTTSSTSTI